MGEIVSRDLAIYHLIRKNYDRQQLIMEVLLCLSPFIFHHTNEDTYSNSYAYIISFENNVNSAS